MVIDAEEEAEEDTVSDITALDTPTPMAIPGQVLDEQRNQEEPEENQAALNLPSFYGGLQDAPAAEALEVVEAASQRKKKSIGLGLGKMKKKKNSRPAAAMAEAPLAMEEKGGRGRGRMRKASSVGASRGGENRASAPLFQRPRSMCDAPLILNLSFPFSSPLPHRPSFVAPAKSADSSMSVLGDDAEPSATPAPPVAPAPRPASSISPPSAPGAAPAPPGGGGMGGAPSAASAPAPPPPPQAAASPLLMPSMYGTVEEARRATVAVDASDGSDDDDNDDGEWSDGDKREIAAAAQPKLDSYYSAQAAVAPPSARRSIAAAAPHKFDSADYVPSRNARKEEKPMKAEEEEDEEEAEDLPPLPVQSGGGQRRGSRAEEPVPDAATFTLDLNLTPSSSSSSSSSSSPSPSSSSSLLVTWLFVVVVVVVPQFPQARDNFLPSN